MLVVAISEISLFVPSAKHAVGPLVFPTPARPSLFFPLFTSYLYDQNRLMKYFTLTWGKLCL